MKNHIKKIVSYILGITLFISSYKLEFKGILNKDKIESKKKDITTSTVSNTENKTIDSTIEIENETTNEIFETEIVETNNTVEQELSTTENTNHIIEIIPTINKNVNEIIYATTDVNLRSSNTTESLKIGNLKINESAIKILSYDNNWILVKTENQIGFVHNDYIESSEEYIETEYEHIKQSDIIITNTDLNFRNNPNIDAKIIKTFKKDTELEVIAKVNNEWLLVKNNGIIGYVHSDYTISLTEKAKEEYPELNISKIDVKKIVHSTADDLNIRTGNSTNYEIIGRLDKYESVRVLEEYDDWYFVMTNEYKFGFINKNYTKTLDGIFVVVDISKQRLYLYNNDELYLIGFITSGKSSTPSDIGSHKIWHMDTNAEITPGHFSYYWMIYNSSYEGLHDAEEWRKDGYGTDNYINNGSNGCINMLREDAKVVYENISIGTKVLVHK